MKSPDLMSEEEDEKIRRHFHFKGGQMPRTRGPSIDIRKKRQRIFHAIAQLMRSRLRIIEASRVLDVGTGYGRNVRLLCELLGSRSEIWSVDSSGEVLNEVRTLLREKGLAKFVKLRKGNAEFLPFRVGFFDFVTAVMLVHHTNRPLIALEEMSRVLKPGGSIFLADWKPIHSPVIPHSAADMLQPSTVSRFFADEGYRLRVWPRKYWYAVWSRKPA